jgi:hypothetical protein
VLAIRPDPHRGRGCVELYDVTTDKKEFAIKGTFKAEGVQAESDDALILVYLPEDSGEADAVEGLASTLLRGNPEVERKDDAVVIYSEANPGRAEKDVVDECV